MWLQATVVSFDPAASSNMTYYKSAFDRLLLQAFGNGHVRSDSLACIRVPRTPMAWHALLLRYLSMITFKLLRSMQGGLPAVLGCIAAV